MDQEYIAYWFREANLVALVAFEETHEKVVFKSLNWNGIVLFVVK